MYQAKSAMEGRNRAEQELNQLKHQVKDKYQVEE